MIPVVLALDADRERNPDVRQAHQKLCAWLEDRGQPYTVADWDERDGKGLDDLLLAGKKPRFVDPAKAPAPPAVEEPEEVAPARSFTELGLITSMWDDIHMARRLTRETFKDATCRAAHEAIKQALEEVGEAEYNQLAVISRMIRNGHKAAADTLTIFEGKNLPYLAGSRPMFERDFQREKVRDGAEKLLNELAIGIRTKDPAELAQRMVEGGAALLATSDTKRRPTMKDEFYEWIDRQLAGEKTEYIQLGIPSVDDILGSIPSRSLGILAGAPKMGKSSLAMLPVFHNAQKGFECIVGQLEMTPEQMFQRAAAWQSRKPFRGPGALTHEDLRRIRRSGEVDWFENIHLVTGHTSIESYRAELVSILTRRRGVRFILTDYAEQLMNHGGKTSRVDEADAGSDFAKKLAIQFDLCHLLLVQYGKAYTENGQAGARLNHLKNSGKYEQDAQFVLLLHHPHRFNHDITRNFVLARVAANRDGGTGDCPLFWTPEHFRYEAWNTNPVDPKDPFFEKRPHERPGHGPIPAGVGKNLEANVRLAGSSSTSAGAKAPAPEEPDHQIEWGDLI